MKTIFITIFEGVEAKNILRTEIVPTLLADPKISLVLFTKSRERVAYYQKEFSHPRLTYEVVALQPPQGMDRIFSGLKFMLLRTATTRLRRRMQYAKDRNAFAYRGGAAFNWLVARPLIRRAARLLDYALVRTQRYTPYFEKYHPDAVLLAHLFDEPEIHLLREAKRRRVKTIGFINSWDKITARCIMRLLPDKAVVFNEVVKQELLEYNEMRSADIFVGGIPQYDVYFPPHPRSREEFLSALGIASNKRVIVYAPNGRYSREADGAMLDLLHSFLTDALLPRDVEILVRFQPNDALDQAEIAKRPWLIYDHPGVRFSDSRGVDWDMNSRDIQRLVDTLQHASVLVCYTSSLSVDAAAFDQSVINVKFNPDRASRAAAFSDPLRFYEMAHYQKALATGGIRVVENREELLVWLRRYLADPRLDQAGRMRLVREQCSYTDGVSGKRIGKFVLQELCNTSS